MTKLTALGVKRAPDGTYYDGGGLELRKKNSTGQWVWRFTLSGRRRQMGLGPFPIVGLADARKERDRWALVLAKGDDPISVRERERYEAAWEADKKDPTFADAAQITFEAKQDGLRKQGDAGRWFSPIRLYMIPTIGKMRMSVIHQTDIHRALSPIWKTKNPTAEKALQRTRIVFRHMMLSGADCDPKTCDMARHMLGEHRHVTKPTRAHDWRDIPDIYAALDGPNPTHLCLRWKILTLVRSDGVRGAMFDEIDGDIWTVPASRMKGKEGRVEDFRVPLSKEAMKVLAEAQEWRQGPYMFTGHRSKPLSSTAIAKVLKGINPNGTPHGLRTSFRTWVQETDAAHYDVAETQLAHIVGNKVERSYARSDLLERRRVLLNAWADFVTGEAQKVVRIG